MMNEGIKRALLYGSAILCIGGFGLAWRNSKADADLTTLLSSADVQLRLAYAIPDLDQQGKVLSSREPLIATAEKYLEDVERIEPGIACVAEFRGFAHMLRGQYLEAADCYQRAQECKDCGEEQRDILAFNQARMLAKGGDRRGALAVFDRHGKAIDARFPHQRQLEEATILRELGDRQSAEHRLDRVTKAAAVEPMAWFQAGVEYVELGCDDKAEMALQQAVTDVPIADYYRARLKLKAGAADEWIEFLERATKVSPTEVRRLVRQEPAVWSAVAGTTRFQELTGVQPAQPMR